MSHLDPHLASLNQQQRKAATADHRGVLAIIAGPGSGKTKTLISRVAHLINNCHLHPSSLVVVTFTNKAAEEIKKRLESIIGHSKTEGIVAGTFHSVCALWLRRHGNLIGLNRSFGILDSEEGQLIIKRLIKDLNIENLKPSQAQSMISKAKAKNVAPEDFEDNLACLGNVGELKMYASDVAKVYSALQARLKKGNLLDFDDIIIHALKLFQDFPNVVVEIRHVLVDEFQDTSHVQYNLIKHMSCSSNNITVVGDPDQSIYQWRAAESSNIKKLLADYPKGQTVHLDMTYRSSPQILALSQNLMDQDLQRIKRNPLKTENPSTTKPRLCHFENEYEEAGFIVQEVEKLRHVSDDELQPSDFAILCRSTAQIHVLEQRLMKAQIPYKIVGGKTVAERKEAKDLAAYLVLASDTRTDLDILAFTRVANVPARGLGDAAVDHVVALSQRKGLDVMTVVEQLVQGRLPMTHAPWTNGFTKFYQTIKKLRTFVKENGKVADAMRLIIKTINYEAHLNGLKETKEQIENRLNNVQTVLEHAEDYDVEVQQGKYPEVGTPTEDQPNLISPITRFLQLSSLAPETRQKDVGVSKLTVATLHSSKGLEWPIVFIYGCEDGSIPDFRRATQEEMDEERRLLYVGMTRAEALLYITFAKSRRGDSREFSRFLRDIDSSLLVKHHWSAGDYTGVNLQDKALWKSMESILGRKFSDAVPLAPKEPVVEPVEMVTSSQVSSSQVLHKTTMSKFTSFTSAKTVLSETGFQKSSTYQSKSVLKPSQPKPIFKFSQTQERSLSQTQPVTPNPGFKRKPSTPLMYLDDVIEDTVQPAKQAKPKAEGKKDTKKKKGTPKGNAKMTAYFQRI